MEKGGHAYLRQVRAEVVIRFPDSTEIRYLEQLPRRGQRIQSAAGGAWVVADVLRSGLNTHTVVCIGSREYLDDIRRGSPTIRELASDLLALARRSIPPEVDFSRGPGSAPIDRESRKTKQGR